MSGRESAHTCLREQKRLWEGYLEHKIKIEGKRRKKLTIQDLGTAVSGPVGVIKWLPDHRSVPLADNLATVVVCNTMLGLDSERWSARLYQKLQ